MILSCQHITKSFIENKVLSDVNMTVNENDRIAIVGINGAGKSTLFKILSGETAPDGGQLVTPKKITIGYLKQEAMTDTSLLSFAAIIKNITQRTLVCAGFFIVYIMYIIYGAIWRNML